MIKFRRARANDTVVDLANFNKMEEWLERLANMTTDQNFTLIKGDPNFMLGLRSRTSINYSDFAFGFSISGAVVTVNAGYVFQGMRAAVTVAEKEVTVEEDNTYIYVTYVLGGGAASTTSSLVFPQHAAGTLNWLLYLVTLSAGGTARIDPGNIHHLGSINIPGNFA